MTNHLPECELHGNGCAHDYYSDPPLQSANCGESCICPALRACEQRVQKISYTQGLGAGSDEHGQHEIGFLKGYVAALDAAREAVASMPLTGGWTTPDGVIEEIDKAKTVAAIDALKEKP